MHGALQFERVESFGGGMDGYNRATLLAPDVAQYFENVNVLDNLEARTHPGADTLGAASVDTVQGLIYFDTPLAEQLVKSAGGKIYSKTSAGAWTEVLGWTPAVARLAAAQGVDKLLLSDGVTTTHLFSYDGTTLTDCGGLQAGLNGDPPMGTTILCWHAGRMFASGQAAHDDTLWASKLLEFGQGKWDWTQFSLRIGGGEGEPIVALASLQDFNLCVLKENSVYLVVADPGATTAANWATPKLASGIGCVGRRAWATVGNDVLFMSRDGVRSVRRMAAAAGQYELSPPISEPMQPYIDRINWAYADLIAAHSYKHLVFFAVPLDAATTPDTTLIYNARLRRWTGIRTGWTPGVFETTRFAGVQRLVFGEQTGLVRQWKDFADATADDTYTDNGAAIATRVWLRGMLFGSPINDKEAFDAEIRFSSSNAIVSVTLLGDNADLRTWQRDLRQSGVGLPVDLPFDLFSPAAVTGRRGLRGLKRFNECYLKIESTSGWFALRNVTVRAKLKKVPTS